MPRLAEARPGPTEASLHLTDDTAEVRGPRGPCPCPALPHEAPRASAHPLPARQRVGTRLAGLALSPMLPQARAASGPQPAEAGTEPQGQGLGEVWMTSMLHADGSGPAVWRKHMNVHPPCVQRPKPYARFHSGAGRILRTGSLHPPKLAEWPLPSPGAALRAPSAHLHKRVAERVRRALHVGTGGLA